MEGLSALFRRENPYEKRARVAGAMMGQSGLAKPLLAYTMGKDMASAQEWDDEMNGQIDTYLKKKLELEESRNKTEAVKFQQDSLKNSLEAADKIWNSTANLPDRDRGQAVIEYINPMLSQAGLPPLKGYAQDKNGQRSFELIVDRDEKGNLITKQGYVSNGQLFMQDNVDEKGQPVFKPAPSSAMTLKNYADLQTATKKEAPKTRTVQRGGVEITEEFQPDGTWKEIGKGPKWNPRGEGSGQPNTMIIEHPDTRQRVAIDKKNIGDLQKYLDQGYVPYSTADQKLLQEYLNLIIKPKVDELKAKQKGTSQGTSTIAPAKAGEPAAATLQGNTVIINGKSYPLNSDGTVTIDNKKYRVKK